MKIAIDISQIVHQGTGVANYTSELVRNLLETDKENEYILFGISARKFNELREFANEVKRLNNNVNFRFFPIPQSIGNYLWNWLHIIKIDSILPGIDIFHSSDWIQPPTKAKKITTIHDLVIYRYPELSHPYIVKTQKRRLHWVKKEVDLLIADSVSTKNDLINLLKITPSKIEIVYPGIGDQYKLQIVKEIMRVKQKYGLPDKYILAVGTIEPRKNLKATFSAFEMFLENSSLNSKAKQINLVVVGNLGWESELKFSKAIYYLNYVDSKDLPGLYSGATCFIYPSLYEGFGLPVLEAMSCGCPVISSDRGSLKEIAQGSALFADPSKPSDIATKINLIFTDDSLRKSLIKKGRVNASKFTWRKTTQQVLDLYKRVNFK